MSLSVANSVPQNYLSIFETLLPSLRGVNLNWNIDGQLCNIICSGLNFRGKLISDHKNNFCTMNVKVWKFVYTLIAFIRHPINLV